MTPLAVHDVWYTSRHRGLILAPAGSPSAGTPGPWGSVPDIGWRLAEFYFGWNKWYPYRDGFHVARYKGAGDGHFDGYVILSDFKVPPGAGAAFNAGEDWRPLVDWLLETYPDRLAWLAELIARLEVPA